MLLAALIETAAATGLSYRRSPSSQTCFAQATLFTRYHGGWLASLRLSPCAGRHQSQDAQSCARRTKSLSRNTVHRDQETPFNLTSASTALLHHFFTRRAMGDIAPR